MLILLTGKGVNTIVKISVRTNNTHNHNSNKKNNNNSNKNRVLRAGFHFLFHAGHTSCIMAK